MTQACWVKVGCEVHLLLPSRGPTFREKACTVFVKATGWCVGRARSPRAGGFLEAVGLEPAPGGLPPRFLKTGLQNHFSHSCLVLYGSPAARSAGRLQAWQPGPLGGRGAGVQSCLNFPKHLGTPPEALSVWLAFGEGTKGRG